MTLGPLLRKVRAHWTVDAFKVYDRPAARIFIDRRYPPTWKRRLAASTQSTTSCSRSRATTACRFSQWIQINDLIMKLATGIVVEGEPLPEGMVVTVLAREDRETFEVPRELGVKLARTRVQPCGKM